MSNKSNISAVLSGMKKNYKAAQNLAKSFGGEKVPEGEYEGVLANIKFHQKKDDPSKLSLMRTFSVLSGECKGMSQTDFMSLSNEVGLSFAMNFIEQMGYEIPEDPEDWSEIVKDLQERKPKVVVEVVHSGDFVNMRVKEILDDSILNEDEITTESVTEATTVDDLESLDMSELRKLIKREGLGIRILKAYSKEDVIELIRSARNSIPETVEEEESEASETTSETDESILVSALCSFAESLGIEDQVSNEMSLNEIREIFSAYQLDKEDLEDSDIKLLEEADLSEMFN